MQEGQQAGFGIRAVDDEAAAHRAQAGDEMQGGGQVGKLGAVVDLEQQAGRRNPGVHDGLLDFRKHFGVGHGGRGQPRDQSNARARCAACGQVIEQAMDHPQVDALNHADALGQWNEGTRLDQLAILADHAQLHRKQGIVAQLVEPPAKILGHRSGPFRQVGKRNHGLHQHDKARLLQGKPQAFAGIVYRCHQRLFAHRAGVARLVRILAACSRACTLQHFIRSQRARRQQFRADACLDRARIAADRVFAPIQQLLEAAAQHIDVVDLYLGQQQQEGIALAARKHVTFAQAVGKRMCHGAQQFITAWRILIFLTIQLDLQQGRITSALAQAGQLGNQALAQVTRVRQTGQRVVAELPAQALGGAPFGDIAEHHHRALCLAVRGQRQHGILNRHPAAITTTEHGFHAVHGDAIAIGTHQR